MCFIEGISGWFWLEVSAYLGRVSKEFDYGFQDTS